MNYQLKGFVLFYWANLILPPTVAAVWKGVSCWLFEGAQDGISKGVQLLLYLYLDTLV
jgi:hypothetical protein